MIAVSVKFGYQTGFVVLIVLGLLIILLQVISIFTKLFPSSNTSEKKSPPWRKKMDD
jgi:Na+-transporting methylmalonyl-CoA/oxaloacetate decarboxylase gamma subunit